MTPKVALTIAGSDSGGGAGVQADLLTFAAHRVHGTSALTAVTAQNTRAVTAVVALEPSFVVAQITAVLEDLAPAAAKTGMLANAAIVRAVADLAGAGALPPLVVDPVLVSTSGHALMEPEGVEAYRRHLLPHATVLTPNLREAAVLAGCALEELSCEEAMAEVGRELRRLGPRVVVVKGGHLVARDRRDERDAAPDVVVGPEGVEVVRRPRVATTNDHGTGCTLSAAIAAQLALGRSIPEAIVGARDYVQAALTGSAAWQLGGGHGPLDHFSP